MSYGQKFREKEEGMMQCFMKKNKSPIDVEKTLVST